MSVAPAVRSTRLTVSLTRRDQEEAAQFFLSTGLNPRQTVVLHPGALVPEEGWPVEHYAHLAQALVAHGWQIAITGSEKDRPTTQRLRAVLRCLAVDLTGATTFGSFAAMMASCRLLVCNHPSVSQVAAQMHTPSIVLASGSDKGRWRLVDARLHTVLWPPAGLSPANEFHASPLAGLHKPSRSKTRDIGTDRVLLHARHKLGMDSTTD